MVCAKAIVVLIVSMPLDPTKNRDAALSRRVHASRSTLAALLPGRAVTHESGTCRGRVMAGSDVRLMSAEAHARGRADRRCGRKRCGAHRPCSGVAPLNGVGR